MKFCKLYQIQKINAAGNLMLLFSFLFLGINEGNAQTPTRSRVRPLQARSSLPSVQRIRELQEIADNVRMYAACSSVEIENRYLSGEILPGEICASSTGILFIRTDRGGIRGWKDLGLSRTDASDDGLFWGEHVGAYANSGEIQNNTVISSPAVQACADQHGRLPTYAEAVAAAAHRIGELPFYRNAGGTAGRVNTWLSTVSPDTSNGAFGANGTGNFVLDGNNVITFNRYASFSVRCVGENQAAAQSTTEMDAGAGATDAGVAAH